MWIAKKLFLKKVFEKRFEKSVWKRGLKKVFEQMIFGKDIIGIIDKYIGRYRLTKINIEYHTMFQWAEYTYNKTTFKSYNYRGYCRKYYTFKYLNKHVLNKHMKKMCELPKNYVWKMRFEKWGLKKRFKKEVWTNDVSKRHYRNYR